MTSIDQVIRKIMQKYPTTESMVKFAKERYGEDFWDLTDDVIEDIMSGFDIGEWTTKENDWVEDWIRKTYDMNSWENFA